MISPWSLVSQVDAALLAEPLFQSSMVALLPPNHPQHEPVTLAWLCANNLLMMQTQDPLGRVLHARYAIKS
ncbi:Uncharacterised protein [Klebsiella quasipneumoniae]|nr:Uncharacterised protein [Klebsiella quasipneumoniae]